MCPSTHNMDLIRSSCLMLVIKLKKKKKRSEGGGFVHPLLCPGDHKLASRAHLQLRATLLLKYPGVPGTPLRAQTSQLRSFLPLWKRFTDWLEPSAPTPPPPSGPRRAPPAPRLQNLHQR